MDRALSFAVPPAPESVGRVRAWIRTTCAAWGLGDGVVDDATLLAGELVGNGVLHGRSPLWVRLAITPAALRIEVYDEDARLPCPSVPNLEALGGRGLQIVAAVARSWGADPVPGGKRVWCELATRPVTAGRTPA